MMNENENENEKLMLGVMRRFSDYMVGVCQMAYLIRQLEIGARELVEDATELLASARQMRNGRGRTPIIAWYRPSQRLL